MRISIVTESFLPHVNGVTNSVLRIIEHLAPMGHHVQVVTPIAGQGHHDAHPVVRLPSLPMPGYPEVAISLAGRRTLRAALSDHTPDVVHLASPFVVGPSAVAAAADLGVPVVAAFQTDVAGFARHYGLGAADRWVWRRLARIHAQADRTLAPSSATMADLAARGVPRLALWPRGVDSERFSPAHRSEAQRAAWGGGRTIIGYVGRLAPEKEVDQLQALADLPGVHLVVIGDGPSRAELQRALPRATFTGFLHGDELSRAVASLDVMVHTGRHETFCQSVQEALSSGVPVVAPAAGGPLDLVDPSRNGWLYEPGNVADLRARVLDLTGDEAKRRAMGRAARQSVLGRSWARVMRSLEAHYAEVLEARTPAGASPLISHGGAA